MKLNKAIESRWSPRAFSTQKVTEEIIDLLFEAARWAPSAMNEQPWTYYFVQRDNDKVFYELLEILTGINPGWAKHAQVLIVSVIKKHYDHQNRPNKNALHDLGAANFSIALQAAEMGLQAHQMAGFDKEKASVYLNLDPSNFEPVTFIAIGFPGDADQLSEELKIRELQPRKRKPISEFAFRVDQ